MELHHVQRAPTAVPHVVTPATSAEAIEAMARPGVRAVAGGTDLLVELDRAEHRNLTALVDLTRVEGWDDIAERDGRLHLGPLVTHNRCVVSEPVGRLAPALALACHEIGSPQLRNRATVAGNVVTASPANDTLTPLLVHDAVLTLESTRGRRTVGLADFHLGVRRTSLGADELVTGIDLEPLPEHRSVYLKLGLRRAQAISVVHLALAARFEDEAGGTGGGSADVPADDDADDDAGAPVVSDLRLALGSVAPTVVRVDAVEAALVGRPLTDDAIAAAAVAAAEAVEPIDDLRAPARYRSDLVVEMVGRALRAVRVGEGGRAPERPVMLWGDTAGRWPTGPDHGARHDPADEVACTLNGSAVAHPWGGRNLLDWVRSTGATGTKEGCAEGECGSCTVHLDGMAVLSCLVPATRAHGADLVTIEGLGRDGSDPLQTAFVETGAVQCGFCIPGFLMSGAALTAELAPGDVEPDGTDPPRSDRLAAGLSGNLCRCTGYYKITDAVARVVQAR